LIVVGYVHTWKIIKESRLISVLKRDGLRYHLKKEPKMIMPGDAVNSKIM
jgi:hypothetical protein